MIPSALVMMMLILMMMLALFLSTVVQVLMGRDGHPGDQDHELPKAQLLILILVQILEQCINFAGLGLVLQEEERGRSSRMSEWAPCTQRSNENGVRPTAFPPQPQTAQGRGQATADSQIGPNPLEIYGLKSSLDTRQTSNIFY